MAVSICGLLCEAIRSSEAGTQSAAGPGPDDQRDTPFVLGKSDMLSREFIAAQRAR
jgi:hypothetical protein